MKLSSGCLCGIHCRYDGGSEPRDAVLLLLREGQVIPVCPEQLGGLPTPRPPAEIAGGDGHDVLAGKARVLTSEGEDVTDAFIRGAREVLRLAKETGADEVILTTRSPSCGFGEIKQGGRVVAGDGVTGALLRQEGIRIRCID